MNEEARVLVSIVMGSDSDLIVMKEAVELLNIFGVRNEVKVVSAHRTTKRMISYAMEAQKRGLEVIIAGAGGSAHLPGMVASLTSIPVIGVPIKTAGMDGLESLLSIVQMPPGIPVGTVAINGAKNAAILACQILAIKHKKISTQIRIYKKNLEKQVTKKAKKLESIGYKKYLANL
jgi:5-(carboxyamino)imidazole ribonucleotide mutase